MSFSSLDLPDYILRAIETVGYKEPTAIQKKSIPPGAFLGSGIDP